ncbi:MAG: hypothetical protein IKN48_02135 [Bacteroidaceae bacterium]|nr:hypothetical protein [Bacteroidaceae bacterium]
MIILFHKACEIKKAISLSRVESFGGLLLTLAITIITITVYFPRYIVPANFAEEDNNPKIKAAKVA